MELPGTGIILTSDSFFYFSGQVFLWAVLLLGGTGLLRSEWGLKRRLILAAGLVFAFLSSLAPLFLRWVMSQPGLGGPDAGGEEFWISFFVTLPQTIAFALLLWLIIGLRAATATPQEQPV